MTATSEVTPMVTGPRTLFAALAGAQAEMKAAMKDAKNPHCNSKYADLASVWEACRDALTRNGLCVIQEPVTDDKGRVGCITTLGHDSGESRTSPPIWTTPRDQGPQAVGSCITYLRRYQLAAMVGVAPEDDDGNAGQGGQSQGRQVAGGARPANQVKAAPAAPMATDAQKARIHILKGEVGGFTDDAYRKALGAYKNLEGFPVKSSTELTFDQAANLLTRLDGMKARQADAHAAMEEATPDNVSHLNAEREEDDARMQSGMADEPAPEAPLNITADNAEHASAIVSVKGHVKRLAWKAPMIKLWFGRRWPDLSTATSLNDILGRLSGLQAKNAATLLGAFGRPVYDAALAEMVSSGEVSA